MRGTTQWPAQKILLNFEFVSLPNHEKWTRFHLASHKICAKKPSPIIIRPKIIPPVPNVGPVNKRKNPRTIKIDAGLLAIILNIVLAILNTFFFLVKYISPVLRIYIG